VETFAGRCGCTSIPCAGGGEVPFYTFNGAIPTHFGNRSELVNLKSPPLAIFDASAAMGRPPISPALDSPKSVIAPAPLVKRNGENSARTVLN